MKTGDNTVILLTNRPPPLITVNEISQVLLLLGQELYKIFTQISHLKRCILTALCGHAVQFYIRTVSQQTPPNADKACDILYTFLSIRDRKTFCQSSPYCHEVSVD